MANAPFRDLSFQVVEAPREKVGYIVVVQNRDKIHLKRYLAQKSVDSQVYEVIFLVDVI